MYVVKPSFIVQEKLLRHEKYCLICVKVSVHICGYILLCTFIYVDDICIFIIPIQDLVFLQLEYYKALYCGYLLSL